MLPKICGCRSTVAETTLQMKLVRKPVLSLLRTTYPLRKLPLASSLLATPKESKGWLQITFTAHFKEWHSTFQPNAT
jgi:hypothetical protein